MGSVDVAQLFVLMLPFVPESPIYHIRKGNEEKAKKCLVRLYGTAPDYDVVSEVCYTSASCH